MPHPKKRRTKRQQGHGRAHLALKPKAYKECAKCKKAILPHHSCDC